jgi:hypothetical protein
MPRSRRSIYRLHDVMIAVAFTAISLAWVQAEWDGIRRLAGGIRGWSYRPQNPITDNWMYLSARSVVATAFYVLAGVASPWAVFLLYRSRRSGRDWRYGRVRRPGAIACRAATVVLTFELIHATVAPALGCHAMRTFTSYDSGTGTVGIRHVRLPGVFHDGAPDPFCNMLHGMPRHAGVVVAGAWLTLRLARAWRPEPTWVDRAGRALGVFWLVAALHFFLFPL